MQLHGEHIWGDGISPNPPELTPPGLPASSSPAELPRLEVPSWDKLSQHSPITQVNPPRNSKEHKFQAEQLPRW